MQTVRSLWTSALYHWTELMLPTKMICTHKITWHSSSLDLQNLQKIDNYHQNSTARSDVIWLVQAEQPIRYNVWMYKLYTWLHIRKGSRLGDTWAPNFRISCLRARLAWLLCIRDRLAIYLAPTTFRTKLVWMIDIIWVGVECAYIFS
jgi:hypothetical protein